MMRRLLKEAWPRIAMISFSAMGYAAVAISIVPHRSHVLYLMSYRFVFLLYFCFFDVLKVSDALRNYNVTNAFMMVGAINDSNRKGRARTKQRVTMIMLSLVMAVWLAMDILRHVMMLRSPFAAQNMITQNITGFGASVSFSNVQAADVLFYTPLVYFAEQVLGFIKSTVAEHTETTLLQTTYLVRRRAPLEEGKEE